MYHYAFVQTDLASARRISNRQEHVAAIQVRAGDLSGGLGLGLDLAVLECMSQAHLTPHGKSSQASHLELEKKTIHSFFNTFCRINYYWVTVHHAPLAEKS